MTEFFVATDGRDDAPGTQAQPVATLARARDLVRAARAAGKVAADGATVWVHGGRYELAQPLEFTAADSGRLIAPVVYRAAAGEAVTLSGARTVPAFAPVTDADVLARLVPAARGQVVQADLKALGLTELGHPVAVAQRLELFYDDQPMTLARWPNAGFAKVAGVSDAEPMKVHGISGSKRGVLTYEGERPARWAAEPELWLHGYWFWDWADSFMKVAAIDAAAKRLTLAPPEHGYGYRAGQRFYALNALCELDAPGEWYVDRARGVLYFWPPAAGKRACVSVLPELLRLKGVSHLVVQGFTLEGTRGTAVVGEGGASVCVRDCTIRNVGGWAVRFSGGRGNGVSGCTIYHPGEGGVALSGGDLKTLTPCGHYVEDCEIHHFSRIARTYRPAANVSGVGVRVAHNHFHHAPHDAIQLGGNEHVIEFNEVDHVCEETGDVGAFYMGRDWTARGTIIRHNYFHDIEGPGLWGANAVYLDDAASGIRVVGNLFVRAGRAAFIGGGRDCLVENNVFVDCPASVHVDARGLGWMTNHIEAGGTLPERLGKTPYQTPPWSELYPELLTVLTDEPGAPKYNLVRRNVSFGGKWLNVEAKAMPLVLFQDNLVDVDPHFVDAARGNYQLRDDSPAFALGFQRLPLDRIGPRRKR